MTYMGVYSPATRPWLGLEMSREAGSLVQEAREIDVQVIH